MGGYWHLRSARKPSGGKLKPARKKRRFERGGPPAQTLISDKSHLLKRRTKGGGIKLKLLQASSANVLDPATGKSIQTQILGLESNPANPLYQKRGIITKGAIIRTKLGLARVTSRPGQHGTVNAVLISGEIEKF